MAAQVCLKAFGEARALRVLSDLRKLDGDLDGALLAEEEGAYQSICCVILGGGWVADGWSLVDFCVFFLKNLEGGLHGMEITSPPRMPVASEGFQ